MQFFFPFFLFSILLDIVFFFLLCNNRIKSAVENGNSYKCCGEGKKRNPSPYKVIGQNESVKLIDCICCWAAAITEIYECCEISRKIGVGWKKFKMQMLQNGSY